MFWTQDDCLPLFHSVDMPIIGRATVEHNGECWFLSFGDTLEQLSFHQKDESSYALTEAKQRLRHSLTIALAMMN